MSFLYLTADEVGIETGGGKVTANEYRALRELGPTVLLSRKELGGSGEEPWKWDDSAFGCHGKMRTRSLRLAHVYAGTWPKTIRSLKHDGCKVAVTVAAHDRHVSRREHEALGIDFARSYPHLVEEELWQRYVSGYALADVIVCPSTVARDTVRGYGGEFRDKDIRVIPHGVERLPEKTAPPPPRFTVGYLGSCGAPDKGLRYLLAAWKKLDYPDAVLLLGGRDSASPWVRHLIETYGGGNVVCTGWVKDPADFYARCSLYVQPSATEGFGIEVLEAMACGRPVLCSRAAGAQDCVPEGWRFDPCDAGTLAEFIRAARDIRYGDAGANACLWRSRAEKYTWDKVRSQYQALWRSMR